MFSGLTNQVSNWMGKKGEDGTELTEEKPTSPTAEDSSPTKGSKMEMLAGVKSQMSGWLSGGIPGLSGRGAAETTEGSGEIPPASTEAVDNQTPREIVQGSSPDHVKDDDASRWVSGATGGADSGPASLEGTPTEDKDGQQPFGAVSTKALAGAKSLGGFLYSAVNKAGKTVVEASAKIKKTVEENRMIAELNKEQDAFIAGKNNEKGEAVAPWVGAPNEDVLREECLALSTDRRNFVRAPPPGVEFDWDFEAVQPMAQATLALDPNLETMRFELVPKVISEENFWRNYFYRVSLLRQSHELNAMASQAESNPNQSLTSTGSIDQPQESNKEVIKDTTAASGSVTSKVTTTITASPNTTSDELISDSTRTPDKDIQQVKESIKKLETKASKASTLLVTLSAEEEWEGELEAELKDFEIVPGENKKTTSSKTDKNLTTTTSSTLASVSATMGKEDWEQQMDELLDEDEDLK
ncbi:synapse-associated protein of 47 kDa isoform X2 [Microplitis demolitor]|uniref:synapse-associated protein of 47 kDa isoform X2 n=1 Tax=Microplitis demolitor TaxID=69319 RepID=UPI00235B6C3F|nr:synapse-associated protein of 47 kDa isoform X2 [Microplitis demolitor]